MEAQNRVVVTGMGIVAPNGIGLDAFWTSLLTCKSGIGPITLFDTSDFKVKIAGEVRNFDLREHLDKRCKPHRLSRQTQLGLAACKMAVEHAGLTKEMLQQHEPLRMVLGISSSGADIIESAKEIIMTRGADRVRPYMVGACQPSATAEALVQFLEVQTSVTTVSNACPSGLDAVEMAANIIKKGCADLVIVGAADSPLNTTGLGGFTAAGLLPVSTEFPPEEVSRPFDAKSAGGVMAEGAGFLVLERLDSALARGAVPYMEILGGALTTDAPGAEPLEGLFRTMGMAMTNAGVYPEQVDYICANAPSALTLDRAETKLIKKLFGERAYQIPISSIKGVLGNSLAPGGIFQVITCALSMMHQIIPPTANLTHPDPECDLDYVPLKPRKANVNIALANGHGISRENSTLIMKRVS